MKSLFKTFLIALTFIFFTSSLGFTAPAFKTITYTGTGSEQSITGLGFKPDFVWIKCRTVANSHRILDSIRGETKSLVTNSTSVELTETIGLIAFNDDGFTVSTGANYNTVGATYVAWCWKAGDEIISNSDGNITSTVSANPDAGFSIVKYTGNGLAGASIGHGLNLTPSMIIVKSTTAVTDWTVYHKSMTAFSYMNLQETSQQLSSISRWNNTEPTDGTVTIGISGGVNTSGEEYIAYIWTEVSGTSSFGTYTGTGNTDGPIIECGFEPAYVMIKRTDGVSCWNIFDNKRDTQNPNSARLWANLADAEVNGTGYDIELTTTGFKVLSGETPFNASSGEYIYMAFSEADVDPSPPEIVSFTSDKDEYDPDQGDPVILSWEVANADADTVITISGIGTVDPSGSVEVRPSSMTNYVLSATGLGETVTQEKLITVASGYKFTGDFTVDGKIGVGVLEPIYALEVNGTIKAKEVIVTMDGWADYVFDDKYKLRSLNEVEKFIKKNKHLPEMKPGNTIEQNGLSVSEILKSQQQKIEELTLYMIALKKENEGLKIKTENKQLINRVSLIEQTLSKIKH